MLMAAGGAPLTAGGPGTSAGSGGVRVIKNSLGMTFVRVPAGSFSMGTAASEAGHREHEGPAHEVKISKPMFVSVAPVTQAQYEKVLGKNPAKFNKSHGGGPDHPVENVSWHEAVRFCDMLAQRPDEEIHNRSYRLPTEAEWEYMCRAGTQTAFATGDRLGPKDGIFAGSSSKYAGKSTGPVAHCTANAFGLHDMHGNVQEWVNDWYDEYYYFESPPTDPQGPARGQTKVIRGGCWAMFSSDCRSGARRAHGPDKGTDTIGFRVIMMVG
jgi:formylglycine-generating enzyme required for sulfatase activity